MAMEKFHYKTSHGEIVLPRFKNLPGGLMRTSRKLDPEDRAYTLIEGAASEKVLDIFDKLTQGEQAEMMQEWQAESQVTEGESSAS